MVYRTAPFSMTLNDPKPRFQGQVSTSNWQHRCIKSLHGCAPSYLSNACKSAPEASHRLRSSDAITCVIPWSRTHLGNKSFDVAGPRLWNKLPASLRWSHSLCQFRRQLKTFLFVKDKAATFSDYCFRRWIQILLLTYLLTYYTARPIWNKDGSKRVTPSKDVPIQV